MDEAPLGDPRCSPSLERRTLASRSLASHVCAPQYRLTGSRSMSRLRYHAQLSGGSEPTGRTWSALRHRVGGGYRPCPRPPDGWDGYLFPAHQHEPERPGVPIHGHVMRLQGIHQSLTLNCEKKNV